jgi:RNA polymerase sigma-70 factor (ECF subfamily)
MKTSKQDDVFLIQRIAQAQADALSQLYDRYNRLVFSVACAILNDRAVAEEVTLDVFVRVWRNAGTYRAELGRVDTWLVAITRHHAIDTLRWQNSRVDAHSLQLDDAFTSDNSEIREPEEGAHISIQREAIRGAVAQLPQDQREAVTLAYFRGYTHQEIAEFLGQPLGTVKTRIRLAMHKLRQMLEGEHNSDTSGAASDSYSIDKKER